MTALLFGIALLNLAVIIIAIVQDGVKLWLALPATAMIMAGIAVAMKRQIDNEW